MLVELAAQDATALNLTGLSPGAAVAHRLQALDPGAIDQASPSGQPLGVHRRIRHHDEPSRPRTAWCRDVGVEHVAEPALHQLRHELHE